ncbi:hypothetical protein ANCCEY_13532 [Ancylostoma ceylanicum]|uniref:Uncharacterized protein n=1 Tax=Ancylostoma ceylanicum TaxID=53326 RepID=A0A0D6L8M8_9BILA|nr:hypothetical protein ANCCEY_13532 [Ancylostoma ceylanicum]
MFFDVFKTFCRFFLTFMLFIVAFSIAFYAIMQNRVGLAVDDIKSVQEKAELKRLSMQVLNKPVQEGEEWVNVIPASFDQLSTASDLNMTASLVVRKF